MSKGGGGSSGGTATTRPWSQDQRDALTAGYRQAPNILNTPTSYYPGSTVAQQSPYTQAGVAGTTAAALQPGLSGSANGLAGATLNGQFLAPNPWLAGALQPSLDQAARTYQTSTVPGIDSEFARAGRFGSGAQGNAQSQAQQNFAQALTNTSGQLAYQNYGDERQRQMQTLGMAPQTDAMRYDPATRMLGVGAMQDQYGQALVGDDANRFNYTQNEPYQRLQQYMQLLGGNSGSMTQQNAAGGGLSGMLGGGAGGALSGLALAGMAGMPLGWGLLGGAALGGLSGAR